MKKTEIIMVGVLILLILSFLINTSTTGEGGPQEQEQVSSFVTTDQMAVMLQEQKENGMNMVKVMVTSVSFLPEGVIDHIVTILGVFIFAYIISYPMRKMPSWMWGVFLPDPYTVFSILSILSLIGLFYAINIKLGTEQASMYLFGTGELGTAASYLPSLIHWTLEMSNARDTKSKQMKIIYWGWVFFDFFFIYLGQIVIALCGAPNDPLLVNDFVTPETIAKNVSLKEIVKTLGFDSTNFFRLFMSSVPYAIESTAIAMFKTYLASWKKPSPKKKPT